MCVQKDKQGLYKVINYEFVDPGLLESAISHRSAAGKNNERLEFLGDSIINFLIAEALYLRYPKAKEGELSRLRANLVRGETLAKIASAFKLGSYLRLGSGELKSGGRERQSILADALEAVIAAIYLDSNLEQCRMTVLPWFEERLNKISPSKIIKDPKSALQEFLQARKLSLPVYEVVKVEGEAHSQIFTVTCRLKESNACEEANGDSRRKAEQAAAEKTLKKLQKVE